MEISIDHNDNPLLSQFTEDGFVKCVFKINSIEETECGYLLNLKASFDGAIVGLNVGLFERIDDGINPTVNAEKNYNYSKVKFYRSGIESDLLLTALARLYKLRLGHLKMTNEIGFSVFSFTQDSASFTAGEVRLKLFHRNPYLSGEVGYSESFFHVDIANGVVFWNEKEIIYRHSIIRALSKKL